MGKRGGPNRPSVQGQLANVQCQQANEETLNIKWGNGETQTGQACKVNRQTCNANRQWRQAKHAMSTGNGDRQNMQCQQAMETGQACNEDRPNRK
ncbi:hypothetical protein TNIN_472811 [Trichonephila inaurata madagascariensis]|uniref:Uncharacterized protein n=1 Tax=Trichonephila inaurata madagascariensis TaxID=2747483 RepID=A0A8X7CR45_9ARAC|nr:hypothetical protein TNIN_472811 [Trichonephila inaurata madagascariensis]